MIDAGFKLYILFIVSWFIHLPARLPILGKIRFDLLLFAILLIITIIEYLKANKQANDQPADRIMKSITALIVYVLVTIPLVEWPGSVIKVGLINFVKAVVFFYFTITFVDSTKKLNILLVIFVACQTFRVVEPLYLHVTIGYWGSSAYAAGEFMDRLSGAPHDFINPNGLAYVIVSIITFYYFLSMISFKYKVAAAVIIPISMYAMVLTASRSGVIVLFVVLFNIYLYSEHKKVFAMVAVIVAVFVLAHLGPKYIDRYKSIYDSTAMNSGTSQARIDGIKTAIKVALNRPLFGHGLGTSLEASYNIGNQTVMAHNLYAQVAQELGFVGLFFFLNILRAIVTEVYYCSRQIKNGLNRKTLIIFFNATKTWLVMNLVFSLASYGLSGYAWYFIAGLTVVIIKLMNQPVSEFPNDIQVESM